jgi:unsaturated rhamnogalacturonyl hydrolase
VLTEKHVRSRASAAADVLSRYPFRVWGYGDSIGFEGLLAATELLAEPRYEAFVYGMAKGWVARSEPFVELDNTAPGHALCLSSAHRDAAVLAALERLAAFLVERPLIEECFQTFKVAPLKEPFGDAGLTPHERRLMADPGPGVFVDCLHFDAPFLTHLGRITDNPALVECGVKQARAMVRLLQDSSGIFSHFYLPRTGERYGFGWSRGQGWALLGLLDVLEQLSPDDPANAELANAAFKLGEAVVATQGANGHWPALIHEADSFLETSAAFFFAIGLARGIRSGCFPKAWWSAAERAFAAGLECVNEDGSITGVSAEIWACTSLDHYRNVPVGFQVPWGQGPFLAAARAFAD